MRQGTSTLRSSAGRPVARGRIWLLATALVLIAIASFAFSLRALSARGDAQHTEAVHRAVSTIATANLESVAGLTVDRTALAAAVMLLKQTRADEISGLSVDAHPQADPVLVDIVRSGSSLLDPTASARRPLPRHQDLVGILDVAAGVTSRRARIATVSAVLALTAGVAALLIALSTWARRRVRRRNAAMESDEQRLAQHRLRALLSDTTEIVLVISPTGRITYRSRTADRLLAPSATHVGDLVGCAVHDDAHAMHRHLHSTETFGAARAFPLITVSGENAWFELRVSDFSGNELIGGRVITIRNVNDEMALLDTHGTIHRDVLTGLPDRRMLEATLHQATAVMHMHQSSIALMIIDIDGFKRVNGALGPEKGDTTLKRIASRLRRALAPGETLLRLGGDEFSVVLPGLDSPSTAIARAEALLNSLSGPLVSAADAVRASIGIAVADSPTQARTLLSEADHAMNQAKRQSGNSVVLYEQDPVSQSPRAMEVIRALRDADYGSEFDIVYQPIVASDTRTIVAIEALLRWTSPTVGHVEPDEFIPLAEESGHISALGRLVIDRVCHQLAAWHAAGVNPDIPVTINVSSHQLAEPEFCADLLERLRQSSLRPSQIVLEVAESALFDHSGRATTRVHELRAAGFKVWIDDFGSGHCNLSELVRTPVDTIKIDRSLLLAVEEMRTQVTIEDSDPCAIIEAVVSVARTLGSPVVSEGVETDVQRASLERSGVDFLQGYLFGQPVPAHELTASLARKSLSPAYEIRANEATVTRPAR